MPVIERGILVGVVCTCDLERVPPNLSVSATLHGPPIVTHPQASSQEALGLMNTHRVGSLMVVEDRRILGIVTRQDLDQAGVPMHDDPRGYCSCCGEFEHLREHATGTLCIECFDRSRANASVDQGGGD
jgi:CBS-domain-containing membrane protein